MQVVEVPLQDVRFLVEPPFGGEATFLILVEGDDVIGACFVPPVQTRSELAHVLAAELGDIVRTRAVVAALGDGTAWRATPLPSRLMPVSVVVPTKDRPVQLRRCLAALRPQLAPGDELVVVDNSASTSGAPVATKYGATLMQERGAGSSRARNLGWRSSQHDVVVFIDDDCVPEAGWLAAMRRPFADSAVDAVTGAVVARRGDLEASLAVDTHYPFHRGWTPRRFTGSTGTPDSPFDVWIMGTGASMAFRRELLESVGGFDPALGAGVPPGGIDDLDFFRRALVAGATFEYRPEAVVWHDHPETRRGVRRMLLRHAVASGAELAKVLTETSGGRRRALRVAARDWKWQLLDARNHLKSRVGGASSLPWTAFVAQPPAYFWGAALFLQSRTRLRREVSP